MKFTRSRVLRIVWTAGAWSVLAIGASGWLDGVPEWHPITPVDRTHGHYAHEWRFLNNARAVIPPGSSVTFISADPDTDMQLFMLALGLMPDCTPLPWSYWLMRQEPYSAQAEYLLSYLRDPPPNENVVEIARFERQGLVLKRR